MTPASPAKPTGKGGRALLARLLPLLVLAAAIWIVAGNVTWHDTLTVGASRLEGDLEGDWRAPVVEFHVWPGQALSPKALPEVVAALGTLAHEGGVVTLREGELALGGVEVDFGPKAPEIGWSPGIPHALEGVRIASVLAPFLALIFSTLFVITRWWRLLRFEGCDVRWWTTMRFTYIGLFFNSFIPGLNGGDVARAFAVVRDQPENRSSALMTVVVDRVFGLVAMVLLATVVVLSGGDQLNALKLPVAAFCGAMLLGFVAYLTPWLRRLVRFDALLARLPHGERIARLEASARRLMSHPTEVLIALGLSLGNHLSNAVAVVLSARVLGSMLGAQDWLAVMTIANTLAAVPISPGGLGVGEALFGGLSKLLGGTYVIGVATSLLYRVELLGLAALGGVVMVAGGRALRARVAEARRASMEAR
ncbi:MAG: lysylphosphatidylglycerol synthase transmembrane domain-containing protein [Planctomycetota bacterium]